MSAATLWVPVSPPICSGCELDLRCPLEQVEHFFASLIREGTEAELLAFPGENHELSRAGQPRHRVERFEAILDWWTRHIPHSSRDA